MFDAIVLDRDPGDFLPRRAGHGHGRLPGRQARVRGSARRRRTPDERGRRSPVRRTPPHLQALRRCPGARNRSRSCRARSTPSSARTGRASRRSARSSPASTARTGASSCSRAARSTSARRVPRSPTGSRRSPRSRPRSACTAIENVFLGIEDRIAADRPPPAPRRYSSSSTRWSSSSRRALAGSLSPRRSTEGRDPARDCPGVAAHRHGRVHGGADPDESGASSTSSAASDRGTTIIYVSHFLEEVLDLADTVTVLRDGRVVRTSAAADETPDLLVRAMLGRTMGLTFPEKAACADARSCSPSESAGPPSDNDVSFEIRAGEILGLAGLIGSGSSEVARAIFAADRARGGRGEARRRAAPPALTARCDLQGSRAAPGRPEGAGAADGALDRREHHAAPPRTLFSRAHRERRERRTARRGGARRRARQRRRARGHHALGREPAEGAVRDVLFRPPRSSSRTSRPAVSTSEPSVRSTSCSTRSPRTAWRSC